MELQNFFEDRDHAFKQNDSLMTFITNTVTSRF